MPEQKFVVPACPRRENGHLWRFDRERSTGDCQADVCQERLLQIMRNAMEHGATDL